MISLLLTLLVLYFINFFIGICVCAYIDSKLDGQLLIWAKTAPYKFLEALVVQAWPIILFLYLKVKHFKTYE